MDWMTAVFIGAVGYAISDVIQTFRPIIIGPKPTTKPKQPDDPYRTAANDGNIDIVEPKRVDRTWRVRQFSNSKYPTCDRCQGTISRDTDLGQLCDGRVKHSLFTSKTTVLCPRTKPHFHWNCDCGYEWLMAGPDSPDEETCT